MTSALSCTPIRITTKCYYRKVANRNQGYHQQRRGYHEVGRNRSTATRPSRARTAILLIVVVIAAILVAIEISRHSAGSGPRAVKHTTSTSTQLAKKTSQVLPNAAFHDACSYLTNLQVGRALDVPPQAIRLTHAAVSSSWQEAPQWTGCIWSGFASKSPTPTSAIQLSAARFVLPSRTASLYNGITGGATSKSSPWRSIGGLGEAASFVPQLGNYPAAEIVVLNGQVAFGVEYLEGKHFRTQKVLLKALEPLAAAVLGKIGPLAHAPSSPTTAVSTSSAPNTSTTRPVKNAHPKVTKKINH